MKPVIPKIRVGDVLHGTKNLRNYLRTLSLTRYFRHLQKPTSYLAEKSAAVTLYSPRKEDKFVVAANAHNRFCVWSPNQDVILLFANPTWCLPHRPHNPIAHGTNMSPQIFAAWFNRTKLRMPDLRSWTDWGQYLWGSLHMNSFMNSNYRLPFLYHKPKSENRWSAPFEIRNLSLPSEIDRTTIKHAVLESIKGGHFRNQGPRVMKVGDLDKLSPSLENLPDMRNELNVMISNPRLLQRAKKDEEKGLDYQFLMNVKNNDL